MISKLCKCNGLKLLSDIVDLYTELGSVTSSNIPPSSYIQKKKAYDLTGKLLKIISEKDLQSTVTEQGSFKAKKSSFRIAINSYRKCKENMDSECIHALESIRFIIHNDTGARAKLLCESNIDSVLNKKVKEVLNELRGRSRWSTGQSTKKLIDDLYNEITCIMK